MDKKTKTALLEEKARALRERADYLHTKFVGARNAQVAAEEALERPKMQALVGKCFRYENAGGGSDEKWSFFSKVISVKFNPHGNHHCTVLAFQKIPLGNLNKDYSQVEFRLNYPSPISSLGHEISAKEFDRELRKAKKLVGGL